MWWSGALSSAAVADEPEESAIEREGEERVWANWLCLFISAQLWLQEQRERDLFYVRMVCGREISGIVGAWYKWI